MLTAWMARYAQTPLGIISPVVEILIFSAVVYAIINFTYGTRGAGVLRGFAFAVLAALVVLILGAHWLQLGNVAWLLEHIVSVFVTCLVVIFQPEIRHLLVRLGETVKLRTAQTQSLDKEIADASIWIARKGGVGGLIVLERDMQISAYIESGITIDAECCSALLRTIFTKNTPLHDGAAIIRQGRIVAANCLLPLSENIVLTRGMGTRHRAALGLSEESDALTVVISEETGQISVTLNGRFIRNLDYERLRELIRECMSNSGYTPSELTGSAEESRGER